MINNQRHPANFYRPEKDAAQPPTLLECCGIAGTSYSPAGADHCLRRWLLISLAIVLDSPETELFSGSGRWRWDGSCFWLYGFVPAMPGRRGAAGMSCRQNQMDGGVPDQGDPALPGGTFSARPVWTMPQLLNVRAGRYEHRGAAPLCCRRGRLYSDWRQRMARHPRTELLLANRTPTVTR